MDKRERVKLKIENWFVEKFGVTPTDNDLNIIVDKITYDKKLQGISNSNTVLHDCSCDKPDPVDIKICLECEVLQPYNLN